jgi:RNA polymerase sigma-70 factor (ECF subfamily)
MDAADGLMRSDKELVDAVLAGDRAAFASLIERYELPVRSMAIAILGNTHSAEDVAQDAFTTGYERLASLRNRAAFGAWLLKIAERSAYRMARERDRNRKVRNSQRIVQWKVGFQIRQTAASDGAPSKT